MGSINKRVNSNGDVSFCVKIRKKQIDITKTFFTEEDAKLFIYYKERLIENKANFDIPLAKRITLDYCIDLKLQEKDRNSKEINSFSCARDKFNEKLGKDKFLCELTYEDWLRVAKEIMIEPVYKGTKRERNARTTFLLQHYEDNLLTPHLQFLILFPKELKLKIILSK